MDKVKSAFLTYQFNEYLINDRIAARLRRRGLAAVPQARWLATAMPAAITAAVSQSARRESCRWPGPWHPPPLGR